MTIRNPRSHFVPALINAADKMIIEIERRGLA